MPKGLRHTKQAREAISKAASGAGKGGFNVRIHCPHCQQEMSPANLGKHNKRCEETRGLCLDGRQLSVKELKTLRKHLKNSGWTDIQYIEQANTQENVCWICRKADPTKRLAADHCHKTLSRRGLLCTRCNLMLGVLEDSKELLHRAIEYLEYFHSKERVHAPYKD